MFSFLAVQHKHIITLIGRPALRTFAANSNFNFPKHKELMTEDFYDDNANDNPYAKKEIDGDYESYSQPTHRATATGVLSSYKKQLNLSAKDYVMKDYYEQMKNLNEDVANNFMKADRSNFTKKIVERLRLGKNVKSPVEGAGDEYGNYQKFEGNKNRVEEVNDKGYDDIGNDKFDRNVEQMFQTLNTP